MGHILSMELLWGNDLWMGNFPLACLATGGYCALFCSVSSDGKPWHGNWLELLGSRRWIGCKPKHLIRCVTNPLCFSNYRPKCGKRWLVPIVPWDHETNWEFWWWLGQSEAHFRELAHRQDAPQVGRVFARWFFFYFFPLLLASKDPDLGYT